MSQIIDLNFDREHIWHPYTVSYGGSPVYPVIKAEGASIYLEDGRKLIDGMSSWWSAIHGYSHPELVDAVKNQVEKLSHIMFGGFTHEPAVELSKLLLEILPGEMDQIFLCDSGSVSIEVAIKISLQYFKGVRIEGKTKFGTLLKGYHGDTTGAMSLCDPHTGMHSLFSSVLTKNIYAPSPKTPFSETPSRDDLEALSSIFEKHHSEMAAFFIEPIVQGAGGMNIYSPEILKHIRQLCTKWDILLVADEIATGFGRTGELFACSHGDVEPDIICIGKALTGGMMTMAAVATTKKVAQGVSSEGLPLMHGPTFMANPLACATALSSTKLLLNSPWREWVSHIENHFKSSLIKLMDLSTVEDVRVLGAIGVVEMKRSYSLDEVQSRFVDAGIWVRPFGKLFYLMPPYIIKEDELKYLTDSFCEVISDLQS